jgi:hypothetical protein
MQWFFPHLEIVSGQVDTGFGLEDHFWNMAAASDPAEHIDLTWRQFPQGSTVTRFTILDRHALNDSPSTLVRCKLLLGRVLTRLEQVGAADTTGVIP